MRSSLAHLRKEVLNLTCQSGTILFIMGYFDGKDSFSYK
jgi:hypothetical protein